MAPTATGGRKRRVWGVRAMGTMGVIREDVAALPWRTENTECGLGEQKVIQRLQGGKTHEEQPVVSVQGGLRLGLRK